LSHFGSRCDGPSSGCGYPPQDSSWSSTQRFGMDNQFSDFRERSADHEGVYANNHDLESSQTRIAHSDVDIVSGIHTSPLLSSMDDILDYDPLDMVPRYELQA